MMERGIVDPVKVTRYALQNAASVAAMVLTTESMITEIPEAHPGRARNAADGLLSLPTRQSASKRRLQTAPLTRGGLFV